MASAFLSSPSKNSSSSSFPSKNSLSSNLTPTDAPQDDDVAMLIYTSGTTGKSKGVALSYRALEENTRSVTELWRFARRTASCSRFLFSTCTASSSESPACS